MPEPVVEADGDKRDGRTDRIEKFLRRPAVAPVMGDFQNCRTEKTPERTDEMGLRLPLRVSREQE
jgi:hypothetical protein